MTQVRTFHWTRIAISIFVAIVAIGPLFTVNGYRVATNLISELGAQHTPNSFLMNTGFLILGAGLVLAGVLNYRRAVLPFVIFGGCMAVVGLFGHKPLDPSIGYSAMQHSVHGALATMAGIFVTIGFVWQGIVQTRPGGRILCFYLGAVSVVFPLLMLALPEYQGIVQRLMYLQIFTWLWYRYPDEVIDKRVH